MLGLHLSYASLIACAVLLGARQQRLSSRRLRDPGRAHGRGADGPRLLDPHLCRLSWRRRCAGDRRGAVTVSGGVGALIASGAIGMLVALLLVTMNMPDAGAHKTRPGNANLPKQAVMTPALITLTALFMLLSLSVAGINNFGVVALMSGYGATYSAANIALTAFLGVSAAGVLAGGFLADHTERHGYVAAACFAANAAIVLLIALVTLPGWALTAMMTARASSPA